MGEDLKKVVKSFDKGVKKAQANFKAETPRNVRIAQWLGITAAVASILVSGAQEASLHMMQTDLSINPTVDSAIRYTALLGPVISLLLQFVAKKIR